MNQDPQDIWASAGSDLAYPQPLADASEAAVADPDRLLKMGIWAYFLLLIFEGALRKWFLPGLATPLLVVRDPIAFWLLIKAWQRNLLPSTIYLSGAITLGVISIFTSLFGHANLFVAIYGARTLIIHFPMMFIMGSVFTKEDVLKIGKFLMWIAVPMAILVALQFYSPQSAWVNRGIGGDEEGAGFSGAMGYSRPPGVFSFTTGNTQFFSLIACYIFYFWFNLSKINKLILLAATVSLLIVVPLSISRTLLFQVLLTGLFTVIASLRNPKYIAQLIPASIAVVIGLLVLSQLPIFQTATEVFTNRFESANETEGGLEGVLLDRYLGGLIGALTDNTDLPFLGYGVGMGTNVGSMLLSGSKGFLIAEGEWARVIGEVGPLMGMLVILLRMAFCVRITINGYAKIRYGELLPWILLSFGLTTIPQGQWAQPTSLGFSTVIGGLILASFNNKYDTGNA